MERAFPFPFPFPFPVPFRCRPPAAGCFQHARNDGAKPAGDLSEPLPVRRHEHGTLGGAAAAKITKNGLRQLDHARVACFGLGERDCAGTQVNVAPFQAGRIFGSAAGAGQEADQMAEAGRGSVGHAGNVAHRHRADCLAAFF